MPVAALLAIGPARASLSGVVRIVPQKGRHDDSTDLFLHKGDTITLIDSDDGAVHHALSWPTASHSTTGTKNPVSSSRRGSKSLAILSSNAASTRR
ncbi:hypothetical protein R1A27_32475 (plasmid) [Methylobacterium sp. NMS12]|uniref:hypothetical protein n=1 Tax=Methylobacterium sp. NMS12 TaxID=3079766 RepID=UPI003F8804D6